jgi:hypothetical protein
MNIKFIILLITGGMMYNTYHDNYLIKNFQNHKKYYKMTVIAICGIGFYIITNRNLGQSIDTVNAVKQFVSVLPVDKNSKDLLTPFLHTDPVTKSIQRIQNSGKGNKRSVSEVKKKLVASNQNWKCGKCKQQLSAWFEVDHTIRLDRGGTNEISNLVALCRNCHGEKTFMENI